MAVGRQSRMEIWWWKARHSLRSSAMGMRGLKAMEVAMAMPGLRAIATGMPGLRAIEVPGLKAMGVAMAMAGLKAMAMAMAELKAMVIPNMREMEGARVKRRWTRREVHGWR